MRNLLKISFAAALLLAAGVAQAGWQEGVEAFQNGKLDTAAAEFRQVVEQSPDYAGGHFMLGQVLLKQRDNQEALQHLRKAYELDSGNTSYQLALGQAYVANGRYSDAAQILQRVDAAGLSKKQQSAYYQMLGVAHTQTGDLGAAMAVYEKLTQLDSSDSDAWFRYGTAAFNAGRTDTAVDALERSVQLDGNDPRKRSALAQALVRKARLTQGSQKKRLYSRAVDVAETLAQNDPSYDNLLFLGEVQLGAAQYRQAVSTLAQAASKNGSAWYPHYYMSQAYTLLDAHADAATAAQKALDLVSSADARQRVWDQIGFAQEKQKNFDAAITAYRKAGNQAGVERVSENKRIAEENEEIEQHNEQIEEMEAERERLERELQELGGPPLR